MSIPNTPSKFQQLFLNKVSIVNNEKHVNFF